MVDGQATAGRMPAYWFRSWRRYFVRNHGRAYAALAAAAFLAGLAIGETQRRLRGISSTLPPRFAGDFLREALLGLKRAGPAGGGA